MYQSEDTFELIKALSQTEKRYFRIFSGATGSTQNYMQVFDVLDRQDVYDANALKEKLAGKKINISYEKNYLQKQIQKTLRACYSENNAVIELQDILKTLEILHRKRLTAQSQKLVDKGIAIAEKYEQWNYNLELLEWQYRIYGRTGNYKKLKHYAEEGLAEKEKRISDMLAYARYQETIYTVLTIIQNKGIYTANEIRKDFRARIAAAEKQLKKHAGSFRIRELLYSSIYLMAHYSGDLKMAYTYARENYRLYNAHPWFKTELSFRYFVAIGNLITRCINLQKNEEGLQYIRELRAFTRQLPPFAAQEIQQEQHSILFEYESRILLNEQRYPEALQVAREFERNYNSKNLRKNILLSDRGKLTRVYFANGLLRESLKGVNEIINADPEGIKLDYLIYAHLLRLCIHYDLDKYDVLDYLADTASRTFQKYKLQDEFAADFITLMKTISKTNEPKKHRALFTAAHLRLKKQQQTLPEHYLDFVYWLKKKSGAS